MTVSRKFLPIKLTRMRAPGLYLKIETDLSIKIDIHQSISKAALTMNRMLRNSELIGLFF